MTKQFKRTDPIFNISKNFTSNEVKCKCGKCEVQTYNQEHLDRLQDLRDACGPLKVNSFFRCKDHNKKVGGSSRSQHLYGNATDVIPLKVSTDFVFKKAKELGFKGIIHYKKKGFVHVDSRDVEYIIEKG